MSRQVIIFTHRLSLLALVEDAVKKIKDQAKIEQVKSPVELQIQAVNCLDRQAGIVSSLSTRDSTPAKAVNNLRDNVLPKLKKAHADGDIDAYEMQAKAFCSDLRIQVESCVENVLFNGVLVRFRRAVQTVGRLGGVAKVDSKDCLFIDDLMTRYSVFEHSQPRELPAKCPELGTLEADVRALADWIESFNKRPVS